MGNVRGVCSHSRICISGHDGLVPRDLFHVVVCESTQKKQLERVRLHVSERSGFGSIVLPLELEGELLAAVLGLVLDNQLGPLRDNEALVLYLDAKRLASFE